MACENMHYLINGWFGHDNLGDELLLHAAIAGIRAKDPRAEIAVLTDNPALTGAYFRGVARPVSRQGRLSGRLRFLKEAFRADYYIIAGGTCLRDFRFTSGTIPAVFQYCLLARLLGKKVLLLGIGAGPIWRRFSKVLVRILVDRISNTTVRDEGSLDLLNYLGAEKARHTADLVFSLAQGNVPVLPRTPRARKIGFSLRHWDMRQSNRSEGNPIKAAVEEFVRTTDYEEYLFFSFQAGGNELDNDMQFIQSLDMGGKKARRIHLSYKDGVEAALARINEADVFVGMRLHSLILASLLNKPLIGLAYDPKITGLMRSLSLEKFVLEYDEIAPEKLKELARLCQSQSYSVDSLREKSERNFDFLEGPPIQNPDYREELTCNRQ